MICRTPGSVELDSPLGFDLSVSRAASTMQGGGGRRGLGRGAVRLWAVAALGTGSRLTLWRAVCAAARRSSAPSPASPVSQSGGGQEVRVSATPLSAQQHQPWVWFPGDGCSDACGQTGWAVRGWEGARWEWGKRSLAHGSIPLKVWKNAG